MTVVTKQLPEEAAAIKFVRQKLREIEQDEDHLAQAAEAVDVLPDGIKALARREMSLEKAYRIAVALGLTNEFVSRLRVGALSFSTEPAARMIFERLRGKQFATWKEFGDAFDEIARALERARQRPPYFDPQDSIRLADDRQWFKLGDDGSVVVAESLH